MSTKQYARLGGGALVVVLISTAFHFARGQDRSPPSAAMPGMEMPTTSTPSGATGSKPLAAMPGMEMPTPSKPPGASGAVPQGYSEITVAPDVQQRIGVVLGTVQQGPLTMSIRTVGIIRPNETKIAHIHLKAEGWVQKLFVSFTGQKVKAGDPMLSIYSPSFFTAQTEFLSALRTVSSNPDGAADRRIVVESARRRLQLWDVPEATIKRLEKTGQAQESLIMSSSISGTVLEKKVFEGQYVMPQGELYVVADLSTVWVQARVFEYELPHIEIGMPVTVTLPSVATRQFPGKVVFVDPVADEMTRSVQVRVELPNSDGQLRPGMFCHISMTHVMGTGVTVPTSAVIRTGERDIAYRVVSSDHFVPVQVKISPLRFENRYQVLEGLQAGDEVVISANFLIDSESRLQSGGGSMAGMPGMEGSKTGNGKKPP